MTDLDAKAMSHLTESERELLAEDDALTEDALVPDAGLNVHGASRGAEPEAEALAPARAPRAADEDELRNDPTPALDIHVPHDAAERLAKLSRTKADVIRLFEDGEITAKEYADALERISDQREDLRTRQRMASAAKESRERALDSVWEREVERFMTTTAKDIAAKGEGAIIAFDSYVKKITGDPANAKLSDRAQLAKAHKLFVADFGPSFGGDQGNVSGGGNRDFAAIDRLEGLAYERAVAKMTPAEREAYGID